jgi:hypothetical protein
MSELGARCDPRRCASAACFAGVVAAAGRPAVKIDYTDVLVIGGGLGLRSPPSAAVTTPLFCCSSHASARILSLRKPDRSTASTSVFWTTGAKQPNLRGNPIQHLTHALADCVERSTTAWAGLPADIENDLLARKMFRQRLAFGPSIRGQLRRRRGTASRLGSARSALSSSRASASWPGSSRSERRPCCAR